MRGHPILATVRLEVRRRWPLLLFFAATLAALTAATPWLPMPTALLLAIPAVLVGMAGVGAAWGTVAGDRIQGRFEALRGLPVPLTTVASGRLLLAAVWALAFPLGLLPALLLLHARGLLPMPTGVLALWLGALWALATVLATWLTALTARWPLERWFGAIAAGGYFLGLVAWDWMEEAVSGWLRGLGGWLVAEGATWQAGGMAMTAVLALLALCWWPAVRVLAWAIAVAPSGPPERQAALAARASRGARGYPAGRRGPVAAMAALQLRLAMERLPRQVLVLAAGLVAIPFLAEDLQAPALLYLRILAVALPASVVGRVAIARAEGTLEPLAALPVRRGALALGIAVAVAVLALPAAALMAGATAVARGGEVDPRLAVRAWGALVGSTVLGAGLAAWLTWRVLLAAGLLVLAIGGGTVLVVALREVALVPLLPRLAAAVLAAAAHPVTLVAPLVIGGGIGLLLLARGLATLRPARRG